YRRMSAAVFSSHSQRNPTADTFQLAFTVPEEWGTRASFSLVSASGRPEHSLFGLCAQQVYRSAPPQLEPAPAVQPKQWLPVRISRFSTAAGSRSQRWSGPFPLRQFIFSI